MKITDVRDLAGKPISWVTTTIVMPAAARSPHDVEDLAHQLGVQRARGLVEEHHFGSIASARAIATRCCWPPESCAGKWSVLSASPTRSSNSSVPARRLRLATRTFIGAGAT